jgi:2-dehydropantoate 2-reductase
MKPTSIAVIGAGAIGGVIAARLAAAGQRVTLCSRTPIDKLIVGPTGAQVEAAVDIISDTRAANPADWVFLATKAQETTGAADWMKRLCTPDTTLVVLQNGIDHEDRVQPFSDGAAVLPAIVYIGAERTAPGQILEHGGGRLVVPGGMAADRLSALFGPDSIKVEASGDFLTTSWIKLLGNIFANPVTALTLRRAEVFRDEKVFALARALVAEAIAVGRAAGAKFPENQLDMTVGGARDLPADSGSSMLYDRLAGRPLEHEYLTGAVVRAADRLGVDAPLNRAMLALLSALSEGLAGKTA